MQASINHQTMILIARAVQFTYHPSVPYAEREESLLGSPLSLPEDMDLSQLSGTGDSTWFLLHPEEVLP